MSATCSSWLGSRALTLVAVAAIGCGGSSPTSTEPDLSDSVPLPGGGTLVFSSGGALGTQRGRIERVVADTFDAARTRIPLSGVTIIARQAPAEAIAEIGIGGRADAGRVWMSFDTNGRTWVDSIDTWLGPLLAHELHHVARIRAVGFFDTLIEALVAEGLADRFLVELTGAPAPMWSVALSPAQLDTYTELAREQWFDDTYDYSAWFHGTTAAIPRWAGYTIGFEIAGAWMRQTGRSAAELYAEPARSFVEP